MIEKSLESIRIVDLSMGWAGPLACRQLADMGADIIKVESCERFDWWRSWEATPEWIADDGAEKSSAFNMVNRNKRAITLDLEHPEGRGLFLQLVATADAVVENFSGSVLPKLQLDYAQLKSVKDNIILLSMPAFGSTGPWKNFRAYGSTVEQSSGLPHLNGNGEDLPTMHHVAYGDAVGGLNGAAALLVALRHLRRTGKGQFVDLSQTEGLFPLAAHGIMHYAAHGAAPSRQGNDSDEIVPQGVYPCFADTEATQDSWILIQIHNETQWQALKNCAAPHLDFITDRFSQKHDLDAALSAWTRSQDARSVMYRLQANGVPAAATNKTSELLNDPHLAERGYWQWMERAVVGMQPNPSPPFRSNREPAKLHNPAPTLGQHNQQILIDELGITAAEFARLSKLGIIGNKPRMPSK